LVALIVFTIVTHCDFHSRAGRFEFFSHALFFHNVSQRNFFGINASFWSIAVEVQLYLLYPLLLGMRAKIGLPKSMAVLFVVGCIWRLGSLWFGPIPDHLITAAWTSPLMTWFDWSLGALVAERFVIGQRSFRWPAAWLTGLSALFFASTLYKPLTAFGFMLAAAIAAVALDVALHISWRRSGLVRFLSFVGVISYSIYLCHQPLITPLLSSVAELTGSSLVAWLTLLPELLLVSWLSFLLFERPGISIGRWLWSARRDHNTSGLGSVAENSNRRNQSAPTADIKKAA
jgi:peptidoglycan/LPS O-acetylase OafA/YrhL